MPEASPRTFTAEEALAKAATGELEGGNLSRLKLAKANLAGAKLRKIAATGANLRKADLRGADLSGADLTEADLRNADLSGADLTGANLSRVKASEADFTGARLAGASAVRGEFSKAIFKNVDWPDAELSKAVLYKTRFENANLARAKMCEAETVGADLTDVNLTAADLRDAVFQECQLERVAFADAAGEAADFSLAVIVGADFSRAKLARAQFFGAALVDVNFTGADLAGAVFTSSEHQAVNFQQANLAKASLKSVFGCSEEMLQEYRRQGAVTDLFLFRRFWRLLRRSLAVKIVVALTIVGAAAWTYRFVANPYHWSYEILQKRAEKQAQLGDIDKANRLYQVVIRKYAADANRVAAAKLAMAHGFETRGQFDQALDLYRDVAAQNEGGLNGLSAKEAMANLYGRLGQPERTREIYEAIRQTAIDNPEAEANAEFGLVSLLRAQGRNAEAVERCLAVFDKYQSEVNIGMRALSEAVAALCDLGRLPEAEETFARLQRYSAPSSDSWMTVNAELKIAQTRQRSGDPAGAEKIFRRLYDGQAGAGQAAAAAIPLIELYQAQGNYPAAEGIIAQMLQRSPNESLRGELLLKRASLLRAQGKIEPTIELLREIAAAGADRNAAFNADRLLLELYGARRDVASAEAVFHAANKKFAADPRKLCALQLAMARIYADTGRSVKAQEIFADVIAHAAPSEQAAAKFDLANELSRNGRRDQAEPLYRELYQKRDLELAFGAGLALIDLLADERRFDECRKILGELEPLALDRPAEYADLRLRTVRLLQQEQRLAEALGQLQAVAPTLRDPNKRYDADTLAMDLAQATGDLSAAEAAYRRIADEFGHDRERLAHAKSRLAQIYAERGLTDKAEPLFRQAMAESSNADAALNAKLDLANQYNRVGDRDKAEKLYRELIDAPGDAWPIFQANLSLYDLLADRRNFPEAAKLLAAARQRWGNKDAERAEITLRQARLAARLDKYAEAIALLKAELPTLNDPNKARDLQFALIEMSTAAGDANGAEQSVNALLKSVRDEPERIAQVKTSIGEAYVRRNQDDKAEAVFREVISQYPDAAAALQAKNDLADVRRRRGDLPGAEKILRELTDSPRDHWAVFAAGSKLVDIYADQQRLAEAEQQLERLFQRFGGRPAERTNLAFVGARLYQREGKLDAGIALLREEIPKIVDVKRRADANLQLMEMFAARGDFKLVEDTYRSLANLLADDPDGLGNAKLSLAHVYEAQGRDDLAIAEYQNIAAKPPSEQAAGQARLRLANALQKRGEAAAAEKVLREAAVQKKKTAETLTASLALADLLTAQRRLDEADSLLNEQLKQYAANSNERADVILRRANLLQQQKKADVAVALLRGELANVGDRARRFEFYRVLMELNRTLDNLPAMEGVYRTIINEYGAASEKAAVAKLIFAETYAGKGMNDKALPLFLEAIAADPHTDVGLTARLDLGHLYRRTDDAPKAETTYRGVLEEPRRPLPWQSYQAGLSLGEVYADKNRLGDKEKVLAQMRKLWPGRSNEHDEIVLRQALLFAQEKKPEAAAATLENEVAAFGDAERMFNGYIALIEDFKAMGDARQAAATLQTVETKYAGDPGKLQRARDVMKR